MEEDPMQDPESHFYSPTYIGEEFYVHAIIAIVLGIVGWVLLLVGFIYHLPILLLLALCGVDAVAFIVGGVFVLLQYTCPPHKIDYVGIAWAGIGVVANIGLVVAGIARWLTAT